MARKSHLYEYHLENGKMTEFGGFEMPLWYKGIIEEHNAVRNAAGIFDVSHMGRFSIKGRDATRLLDLVLPTDCAHVKQERAFYSTICNEAGGVIDDTITNKFSDTEYLMVVNAANREKDLNWLLGQAEPYDVEIVDVSGSTSLVAFQGPLALSLTQKICDIELSSIRRFGFARCKIDGEDCLASRTGYTGEDGLEITIYDSSVEEPSKTLKIWNSLIDLGREKSVLPCGLGARDSLRLEAGMCLYGQDIDDSTTPVEAALESVVSLEKSVNFIGHSTIKSQMMKGVRRRRVAFSMNEGGIPRHGYEVTLAKAKIGTVTSGTFSPTVKNGIGMAYVPPELSEIGTGLTINLRGNEKSALVVSVPFYDTLRYGYRRERGVEK